MAQGDVKVTPAQIARWMYILAIVVQFPALFAETSDGLVVANPLSVSAALLAHRLPLLRPLAEAVLLPGTWFRDGLVDLASCMITGKDGWPDLAACRFSKLWDLDYLARFGGWGAGADSADRAGGSR